jgi:hypothetical protein
MTAVAAYPEYTGFTVRAETSGVSADSRVIMEMYREALAHWFYPVHTADRLVKIERALDEVRERCSEPGWDGYDARAITEGVFKHALRLVAALPTDLPLPEVVPEANGEIAFEWYRNPRSVFVASVAEDGRITYAGLFGGNSANGTEQFGYSVPSPMVDNVRRLFPRLRAVHG